MEKFSDVESKIAHFIYEWMKTTYFEYLDCSAVINNDVGVALGLGVQLFEFLRDFF